MAEEQVAQLEKRTEGAQQAEVEAQCESLDLLLTRVCRLHYGRAHALLERIGLHRGQPPVLHVLWEHEGISQTELAERLHVTPATISNMVHRMEKAGFVTRHTPEEDQRVSLVSLTDKGRAVKQQVRAVWRTMEAETFAGYSEEERALVRRYLERVVDNLVRAGAEEPPL